MTAIYRGRTSCACQSHWKTDIRDFIVNILVDGDVIEPGDCQVGHSAWALRYYFSHIMTRAE